MKTLQKILAIGALALTSAAVGCMTYDLSREEKMQPGEISSRSPYGSGIYYDSWNFQVDRFGNRLDTPYNKKLEADLTKYGKP